MPSKSASKNTTDHGYVALDSGDVNLVEAAVRTQEPDYPHLQSYLPSFVNDNAHIWLPLVAGGAVFLSGNLALTFSRNIRLLRRRRIILGITSLYTSSHLYADASARRRLQEIQRGHPAYPLRYLSAVFKNDVKGRTRMRKEMLRVGAVFPNEVVEMFRRYEWAYLLTRSRKEGFFNFLLDKSRFAYSMRRQRLAFFVDHKDDMEASGMSQHDQILLAAHLTMIVNQAKYEPYISPSRRIMWGSLAVAFIAQHPVVLGVASALGACQMTFQLAADLYTMHTVRNLRLFDNPASFEPLFMKWRGSRASEPY